MPVGGDISSTQHRLEFAAVMFCEDINGATNMHAADEYLRDRRLAGASPQLLADVPAEAALLHLDSVEVDRAEGDPKIVRNLRTAQQNSHHSSANIVTG